MNETQNRKNIKHKHVCLNSKINLIIFTFFLNFDMNTTMKKLYMFLYFEEKIQHNRARVFK